MYVLFFLTSLDYHYTVIVGLLLLFFFVNLFMKLNVSIWCRGAITFRDHGVKLSSCLLFSFPLQMHFAVLDLNAHCLLCSAFELKSNKNKRREKSIVH